VNDLRAICVYCGSSNGSHAEFRRAAEELGTELAQREIDLIYGGGSVGLMGVIAQGVQERGGAVRGIIPRALQPKEVSGATHGELIVVETMHERKALMAQYADGFIAMPGGFGTLDELFETVTWGQLGIHEKPIGLLNVCGYFDPLLVWINQAIELGFVRSQHRELLVVADRASDLIEQMKIHRPPPSAVKWMSLSET
jgi:uncharacterized protein (TIGR00730 family)